MLDACLLFLYIYLSTQRTVLAFNCPNALLPSCPTLMPLMHVVYLHASHISCVWHVHMTGWRCHLDLSHCKSTYVSSYISSNYVRTDGQWPWWHWHGRPPRSSRCRVVALMPGHAWQQY